MPSNLTIKDIARLSGVGKSTVSRVLNNEIGVKPETRHRVETVIREQQFKPSKSARAMRGQSDRVVAIIVSRLDSYSENQAVRAMLPLLYERGYDGILLESQFDPRRVQEHLTMLSRRRVDGVLLFGFTGLDERILLPWQERLVVLAWEYSDLNSVCYDDKGAVKLLMETLMTKGLRGVAFIGVNLTDATTGGLRHATYQALCGLLRQKPLAALGKLTYQSGYQLAKQVVSAEVGAVICATDTIALGVCKYLQEQRRDEVVVCGIGNNELLRFLYPHTYSVDLGYAEGGRQALQLLLSLQQRPDKTSRLVIPCELRTPERELEGLTNDCDSFFSKESAI